MTDDQGYGDFGATGNLVIETPAIDRFAAESVALENFYVSPVCSPTRASLMTGRWNYRTRVIDTYLGRSMMAPEEVTIAEALRAAGYRTGAFGKWHLGDCYPMRAMDQGFDKTLVHRGGGLAQPSEPPENEKRYTDPILFDNGRQVATSGYCTDVYFDAAIDFIEEHASRQRPFFAYIATNAPHGPFHDVPEDLLDFYREKDLVTLILGERSEAEMTEEVERLARIAAMITNIDRNVQRLLDALDALDAVQDTIVVLLVDNGPNTRRYVGPFRGMKTEVYEGGVRSPCWIRWPARLAAGVRVEPPTAHIDLMPTILAACGTAEAAADCDGRNLLPLLEGDAATWPERPIVIQTHRGDVPQREHHFMIRQGRWKLVRNSGFEKETAPEGAPFELYNLQKDPRETNDRAAERPELVARLRASYNDWFNEVSRTRVDNFDPPRIVVAKRIEDGVALTWQDRRDAAWTSKQIGHWLLDVKDPGPYSIEVKFQRPIGRGSVVLKANQRRQTASLAENKSTMTFAAVRLPVGHVSLQAFAETESAEVGAYQVLIH